MLPEIICTQKKIPIKIKPKLLNKPFYKITNEGIRTVIRPKDYTLDICNNNLETVDSVFISLIDAASNMVQDLICATFPTDFLLGYVSSLLEEWDCIPKYLLVSETFANLDPKFDLETIDVIMKPRNPKRLQFACKWTLNIFKFKIEIDEKKPIAYMLSKSTGIFGKNKQGWSMAITHPQQIVKIEISNSFKSCESCFEFNAACEHPTYKGCPKHIESL